MKFLKLNLPVVLLQRRCKKRLETLSYKSSSRLYYSVILAVEH